MVDIWREMPSQIHLVCWCLCGNILTWKHRKPKQRKGSSHMQNLCRCFSIAMWASATSRGYDNRLFSACQHQVRLPGLAPIPCIPVQPAWAVLAEENVLLWLFQRFMRTMLLQYNPYKWHQFINKYLCYPLLKCIESFETTSKVQNQ